MTQVVTTQLVEILKTHLSLLFKVKEDKVYSVCAKQYDKEAPAVTQG